MKEKSTLKKVFLKNILFLTIMFASISVMGQVKHIVDVLNYKYSPNELTINVGDTVEWKNTSGNHNTNGEQSAFPSNPESFGNEVGNNWTFTHVFNTPGKYDYQCDPHTFFNMFGKIEVLEKNDFKLTVNFKAMNPHNGQNLQLSIIETNTGNEIQKTNTTITPEFGLSLSGIKSGMAYNIDFYADHNGNGVYDAPPADHAWRIELNDISGDTILNFTHNTNFTDISITTGFESITNSSVRMYPNPANEKVSFETGDEIFKTLNIKIYDISGKLKMNEIKTNSSQMEIDIQHLPDGIYLVELVGEKSREIMKLMKN